ncbi:MAG: transposase [Deltaproteobacteria bacterium]|jgi:hypothetical protein|nr:transposase [Deltaproteobacteria bacterium]
MYIGYDKKKGHEYAKLYTSVRNGKRTSKDYLNLGRVLDKERGIYRNRERGVFSYQLETNSYGKAPEDFVPPVKKNKNESLIVDFGDMYFLDTFIRDNCLVEPISSIGYVNRDTLNAMIAYYVLCPMANCHAHDWWEGSYARILYPDANLTSQRISDFLSTIGDESPIRAFFREYIKIVGLSGDTCNILIDSSGLPDSIHFPLSAIRSNDGDISDEVRLIYVVRQETGLPIYFRYCPGNVIDASTLVRCLAELKESGVNAKLAILDADAGYYSDHNIGELYESKVPFVTRLKSNRALYKELVKEHLGTLCVESNLVEYNGRNVFLKYAPCELAGHKAYAYICLDIMRENDESRKTFENAKDKKLDSSQVFKAMRKRGVFILVSSLRIARKNLLPLYYTRQQVEQVFDLGKPHADLLPLHVQNEDSLRGHLFLTFIATVIYKKLQDALIKTHINPISLFFTLRNQKCNIYNDKVITQGAVKNADDCYRIFNYECPVSIPR